MLVYLVSIVTICLYLWLSVLAFRRWNAGKAMRRFGLLLLATGLWLSVGFFQVYLPEERNLDVPRLYNLLGQTDFALASFISFLLASFALHFPSSNKKLDFRKELLLFFPTLTLAVLSYFNFFFSEGRLDREPEAYFPTYWLYISILIIYFIVVGLTVLIKKFRATSGIQKLQLKYIVISYGVSICFLLFLSIANAIDNIDPITDFWISNAALIFITASAYAVLKYRLLGIRFLIRRSFITIFTLTTFFGVYFSAFLGLRSLDSSAKLSDTYSMAAMMLFVVVTLPWLYRPVFKFIRSVFEPSAEIRREKLRERVRAYAKTVDYLVLFRSFLDSAKEEMKISDLRGLALEVDDDGYHDAYPERKGGRAYFKRDHAIIDYFRTVDRVVVRAEIPFLLEGAFGKARETLVQINDILGKLNTEVAVMVGSEEVAPSVALLPEKTNKSAYSKEEIEFLKSLAVQMSGSFENFFLYRLGLHRAGVEV